MVGVSKIMKWYIYQMVVHSGLNYVICQMVDIPLNKYIA